MTALAGTDGSLAERREHRRAGMISEYHIMSIGINPTDRRGREGGLLQPRLRVAAEVATVAWRKCRRDAVKILAIHRGEVAANDVLVRLGADHGHVFCLSRNVNTKRRNAHATTRHG